MQIFPRWMEGAAGAQVRLGNQDSQASSQMLVISFQFATVSSRVEGAVPQTDVATFFHGKADQPDERIALAVRPVTAPGSRQAFLAVESMSGGQDDVAGVVSGQPAPQGLLSGFRAGSSPEHLLQAPAARSALKQVYQALTGGHFHARDRV